MYSREVMRAVRQSIGLDDPNDTSQDDKIKRMPRLEVFEKCLNWEGIVGFSGIIVGYIQSIYSVSLEPHLDATEEK